MENKEKETAGEIVVQNRFIKWLDNFWYHYKWTVIIVAFFSLVFITCFVQCTQSKQVDIPVVFAGAYVEQSEDQYIWSEQERAAVEDVFESVFRKNGGDEKREVGFMTYNVFTEQELLAKYTDENGKPSRNQGYYYAVQHNQNEIYSFNNYRGTGECAIWLVSPYVYDELFKEKEGFVTLEELLGKKPQNAVDDYALRLGDTAFYRYYKQLHSIPLDTRIVFSKAWIMGATSNASTYAEYKLLYQSIIGFEAP